MKTVTTLRRLFCALALLALPIVSPIASHAAKPTEAEIQAKIDADFAAMVKADAQAAAAAEAASQEAARKQAEADKVKEATAARAYKRVQVVFTTSLGPIAFEIEVERAPLTAANFLTYVDQKRFDGTVFYRSFKWEDGSPGGFIQGGTQNDPKRILKPVPHETTIQTGLSHVDGVISMAQAAPGTATGDFFVIMGDMRGFDATTSQSGYAAFGRVISGMDVVRAIWAAPRSPTKGEGVMKGQMLEPQVKILTARRAPGP